MERVLLTTGGTGGHIFPGAGRGGSPASAPSRCGTAVRGLAIRPGTAPGPGGGHRLHWPAGARLLGRGLRAFAAAGAWPVPVCRARGIIRRFRPQVVAGFGGYAAFAPMLAARLAGVPTVLHEQNAIAGMSNRILGRLARRICLSLPGTEGFDASRTVLTGNPVRAAVVALAGRQHDFSGKRLLVMGGVPGGPCPERACVPPSRRPAGRRASKCATRPACVTRP